MNNNTPRREGTYVEAWAIWLAGFGLFTFFLRFLIVLLQDFIR